MTTNKQAREVEVGEVVRYRHYTWHVVEIRTTRSYVHLSLRRQLGGACATVSFHKHENVALAPDWSNA